MYENIKIRLAEFAQSIRMNDKDFEESINMPKGTLRRTGSDVKSSVIGTVFRVYPQISPDWLLNGDGPMIRKLREYPTAVDVEPSGTVSEQMNIYHGINSKDITLPVRVYEELLNQLKKKDQQLEDAAHQIKTLFEMINSHTV